MGSCITSSDPITVRETHAIRRVSPNFHSKVCLIRFLMTLQGGALVNVALESVHGAVMYACTVFGSITSDWELYESTLEVLLGNTDSSGRLSISFTGPGTLAVDMVSLIPEANAQKGGLNPWPFREDLLQRLRDLTPK